MADEVGQARYSREVDPPPIQDDVRRAYERAVALLLQLPGVVEADGEIERRLHRMSSAATWTMPMYTAPSNSVTIC